MPREMSRRELAKAGVPVPTFRKVDEGAEGRFLDVAVPPRDPFAGMNRTEAAYASILATKQTLGDVRWWGYQTVTLVIAEGVRYTPDFPVILADGTLEFHEVKGGFIRDDARVKLRVAARHTPFRFVLAQYKNKATGWTIEPVSP